MIGMFFKDKMEGYFTANKLTDDPKAFDNFNVTD